jgi:glycine/D-amino acid oxidase-like deaminating enzyme
MHIVIVGAGIIGASIAFHLTARGARVTLIDAGEPGQGTTAVSFAWLNSLGKRPRHYHDLNRRSLDMWHRFAQRLGADAALSWGGELHWAATEAGAAALIERGKELLSWGYPIRLLSGADVKHMEPNLVSGPIACASFSELDGQVETGALVRAAISQATAQGLTLRTQSTLTSIIFDEPSAENRRITGVQTSTGTIPCDVLVMTGGADSPALAALAGIDLPLAHTLGITLITEPTARIFRQAAVVHTASDLDLQVGLRQWPNGSVMIHGGLSSGSGSYGRTDAEVQKIVKAAVRFVPALEDVPIKEVRRGRRPIPADGLPILGFTDAVPNLYLAAMHSGVTLAALVGAFATIEIVDHVPIDLLAPYRFARFNSASANHED